MKKLLFPLIIILGIIGLLFFFKSKIISATTPIENNSISSPVNAEPIPITAREAAKPSLIPSDSQKEIKRCLGSEVEDMNAFFTLAKSFLGAEKIEKLESKIIFFEDGERKFRLQLALNTSISEKEYMEMKLLELDRENLPDLVKIPEEHSKNPSQDIIDQYLAGKRITKVIEVKEIEYENGSIHLEADDQAATVVKLNSKTVNISCGSTFNTTCKCFSN